MKNIVLGILACYLQVSSLMAQNMGTWNQSSLGLPVYQYTGALPFTAVDKDGNDSQLPDDPYFFTGNYRLALFTHVSGIFQFITAERAWARINFEEKQPNYGWNDASIVLNQKGKKKKIDLIGLQSIATQASSVQRYFGTGFARYEYQLENGLACSRVISVKPSPKIHSGNPAFVVTVTLKNNGKSTQELTYNERMLVNFVTMNTQLTAKEKRPLLYHSKINIDNNAQSATADLSYKENTLLTIPEKDSRYIYEIAPPSVFMFTKTGAGNPACKVTANNDTLATLVSTALKPGETKSFNIVIGLRDNKNFTEIATQVNDLFVNANTNNPAEGLFAQQWKTKLPDLSSEKDEVLRREMLWNAHFVEASAKYNEYYKETFIPQGTVYSYHFGDNISNRDHLQAALPACYTNPELAKSCLRYVIKLSEWDGEIKRGNTGFGYTPAFIYKESDEQLYFFNTIAEYLRLTKDYTFLNEKVALYPAEYGKTETVLNVLKKYFIYLKDEIGFGPNGLIKLLNSDWSDSFLQEYSPNKYLWSAESHLNSVMALAVIPKLTDVLKQSGNTGATALINALETYRATVDKAFMKDFGDRKFSARAYLNSNLKFGLDNVCAEPQGYLLQIPTLPNERKKEIYEYVKSKTLAPEKIGLRTREKPLWDGKPEGEDGGIWFALEYPLLLGVATFDKEEAKLLLHKFSFNNYAKNYPQYWVGHWTAPDEMNSTLYREGLYCFWTFIPNMRRLIQGYCSHPHTWPLFCYYKLKE